MKTKTHLLLLIFVFFFFNACKEEKNVRADKNASPKVVSISKDTSGVSLKHLENLYTRRFLKDRDRSLADYLNNNPTSIDSVRKYIYIMPLGNMTPVVREMVESEKAYLEAFFQVPVKIMEGVPLDNLQKNEKIKTREIRSMRYGGIEVKGKSAEPPTEQLEVNSLLDHYIVSHKPKDAAVVLAITDHDMYARGYNFLIGSSRLKNGIGIVSTHRLRDNPVLFEWGLKKLCSKQITNLFSIKNTKDYDCLLNFSNSVYAMMEETPFYLSPRALEKLKANIGFDYTKRFTELRDFWTSVNGRLTSHYSACLGEKEMPEELPDEAVEAG